MRNKYLAQPFRDIYCDFHSDGYGSAVITPTNLTVQDKLIMEIKNGLKFIKAYTPLNKYNFQIKSQLIFDKIEIIGDEIVNIQCEIEKDLIYLPLLEKEIKKAEIDADNYHIIPHCMKVRKSEDLNNDFEALILKVKSNQAHLEELIKNKIQLTSNLKYISRKYQNKK